MDARCYGVRTAIKASITSCNQAMGIHGQVVHLGIHPQQELIAEIAGSLETKRKERDDEEGRNAAEDARDVGRSGE